MNSTKNRDEFEENEPTEMLIINPRKDIWTYQLPIAGQDVAKLKHQAAYSLALKMVELIEPEYMEMVGFELMVYKLVVKKYE